jgi:hypothetical protein
MHSGGAATQPLSDCRKPHLWEATGNLAIIDHVTTYPSASELKSAEISCDRSLTDQQHKSGLAVTTVWLSPAELRTIGTHELSGVCWRYRTDGKLMPPMQ